MAALVGDGTTGSEWKSDRAGLPTRTSDPGSGQAGDAYFNTNTNKIRIYKTSWGDL